MKNVLLLCLAHESEISLNALRELGILHIKHTQEPRGDNLDNARADLARAETALNTLSTRTNERTDKTTAGKITIQAAEVIDLVDQLVSETKSLNDYLDALNSKRILLEPYGEFDPAVIRKLSESGIIIKLYHIADRKPVTPPEGVDIFPIRTDSTGQYFALAGTSEFDFDGKELAPPDMPLSAVLNEIEKTNANINAVDEKLDNLHTAADMVRDLIVTLREKLAYIEAQNGMGVHDKIAYITGFCPAYSVKALQEQAKTNGWGLVISDPTPDDTVPTLVRYPAWLKVMRPVFKFLGIVPGYREADVSSSFFIFLSIFFAMIVGDAGYGLLFLILTPYLRYRKFPTADPAPFRLIYVFSVSTVIWGILTGNYLAIDFELLPPFLQKARIDWLVSQNNSMTFSLLLGAIHLTIAHGWRAIRMGRDAGSLIQAGWILVVWSVFFIARNLLVGSLLPYWFTPVSICGVLAILIGLISKKQWMDLGLLALNLVSCFGDIMSYLRLFALGIASVKVAEAFNGMAADLGAWLIMNTGEWLGFILAVTVMLIILLIGHGLNIILCAMSVLVHGVRLNALEFSLHMGQEWSGFEYKPFAESSSLKIESTA